ncbi:hypothetical protein EKO04_008031 [Ascochyta lentis]|uniref:CENP-V/GFA domain-containing protein n=1 Tax=Ascochyta lentis TaxID=205686 RepID=A0A8H7J2L2_9PLEO|nr:hypothetical protein EKO04_008031 [Ascochyta lentis]
MASADDATVTLASRCLCKANTFTAQVPGSKLPLPAHTCHCTSCRHVTGSLYTSSVRWPEPRADLDVSKLKAYSFTNVVNLLFCPTCSTPMFWEMLEEPDRPLIAFTGTLANGEHTPIKFTKLIFVGDTIDGGASAWLRHPNSDGSECKRFKLEAKDDAPGVTLPQDWPSAEKLTGYEQKTGDRISVRCRCNGIDLVLQRGDYSGIGREKLPWSVDPETNKLLTIFCGCDSCRLQGGIDVWFWTYVEMKHLSAAQHDVPFPKSSYELKTFVDKKDPLVGSLAYYASSTGVLRFFCSTCSATVFFAEDERPEIVDVAVGLLDSPDGARAEGFLSWSLGVVENGEDAKGGWRKGLFDRIEEETEQWRVGRKYPKNWRRVAMDQKRAEGRK